MDISELRRITQYSRDSVHKEIWFAPVLRFFSIYITKLLIHTKITPNQVTLMSASVGIIGGICFSFGSGVPSILGSFFLLLALLLDCVDGEVARYKKMSSLTGLTFDMFAQNVIFISALVGISIGCWKESGSSFSIIGFLTAILFLLSAHLSLSTFTVAAEAMLSNEFSRVNITNMDEKIVNEPGEKKVFLRILKPAISEYLRIPNQKLLFLFFSVLDTIKIPPLVILTKQVSYLTIYVFLLFIVILIRFLFGIFVIARKMQTDRIFRQLKISDTVPSCCDNM